jgi:hypothetical protein
MKEVLLMSIVVRYNFETNSSSMHSLSYRRTDGAYTSEELERSESLIGEMICDAIITVDDARITDEQEIRSELWLWREDSSVRIWESDIDYINSPMVVVSSIREKLHYAIASAFNNEDRDEKIFAIKDVMNRLLPGVEINIDGFDNDSRYNVYARGHMLRGGVERDILYPFLEQHHVSMEEFLTNNRYIVIVNYAEYCKMKFLGMVDESKIINVFPEMVIEQNKMQIKDGVWSLRSCDVTFGRSPFRVLGTVEGKARYALAATSWKNVDEVTEVLQEVYPDLKKIELIGDYSYVDEDAMPWSIPLREFLLNKKYVIISDGDEYCVWDDFKRTKLFNHNEYPEEEIEES